MRSLLNKAIIAVAPLLLCSCATLFTSGDPAITINGEVPEPVTIKTEVQTYPDVSLPAVVKVKRHHLDGQRIEVTSDNYKFNDIILEKSICEWTYANILLGGLIGLGIDLATNCVSKPLQTQFSVIPLPKEQSGATKEEGNDE